MPIATAELALRGWPHIQAQLVFSISSRARGYNVEGQLQSEGKRNELTKTVV